MISVSNSPAALTEPSSSAGVSATALDLIITPSLNTDIIPSSIVTKPLPPASTTPAFLSVGSNSGVCSKAVLAPSIAALKTPKASFPSLRAALAYSEATRATVSIVPSVGFITALYAASTPSSKAEAILSAVTNSSSPIPFAKPLKSNEVITPEFPLAPRKRAEALTFATCPAVSPLSFSSSLAEFPRVIDIFVPVSPSGTGNTFKSSICLRLLVRLFAAEIIASRKVSPLNKCKHSLKQVIP